MKEYIQLCDKKDNLDALWFTKALGLVLLISVIFYKKVEGELTLETWLFAGFNGIILTCDFTLAILLVIFVLNYTETLSVLDILPIVVTIVATFSSKWYIIAAWLLYIVVELISLTICLIYRRNLVKLLYFIIIPKNESDVKFMKSCKANEYTGANESGFIVNSKEADFSKDGIEVSFSDSRKMVFDNTNSKVEMINDIVTLDKSVVW